MLKDNKVLIGKSEDKELSILLDKANRHGLITGASGSGKTITLKVMAESFSDAGVPVFLADVKNPILLYPYFKDILLPYSSGSKTILSISGFLILVIKCFINLSY